MLDTMTMQQMNQQESDDTNWNQLNEDAVAAASTAQDNTLQKTIFLKVGQGVHTIRFLPGGNKLDKLPYMRVGQHSIQVYDPVKGGQRTEFCLCWNFLYESLITKQTAEERNNNTLIGYLIKQGKLTPEDMKKFQAHKCPFCAAFQAMDTFGVEKQTRNKFLKKEQFIWNVFWKQTSMKSGDNKVYIYGSSKTIFNKIVSAIGTYRQHGLNPLSLTSGFDAMLTATGEGFGGAGQGRRYDIQFSPVPSAVNIGQETVYDLAEVASNGFKTYQECVNMLKKFGGDLLQSIGYVIPGDAVLQQQYGNPNAVQVPEPVVGTATPVIQTAQSMPHNPQPNITEETVEINGTIYRKDKLTGNLIPLF